jgi:site-specific DNA-methyltransferase (adenine-specific)
LYVTCTFQTLSCQHELETNRSYNVLFKDESGKDAEAQITAFEDTWHWGNNAESTYRDLREYAPGKIPEIIRALHDFL